MPLSKVRVSTVSGCGVFRFPGVCPMRVRHRQDVVRRCLIQIKPVDGLALRIHDINQPPVDHAPDIGTVRLVEFDALRYADADFTAIGHNMRDRGDCFGGEKRDAPIG